MNTMQITKAGGFPQPATNYRTPTYSLRPGWIVRTADLGRLAGEHCTLIGALRDCNCEAGAIDYGIASDSQLAAIEGQLAAPLDRVFDDGLLLRVVVCTVPAPARLTNLELLPLESVGSVPVYDMPERMDSARRQKHERTVFGQQATAALALRQRWSLSEMKHRADFPTWLPPWVCEIIREDSRAWLELPNAPTKK